MTDLQFRKLILEEDNPEQAHDTLREAVIAARAKGISKPDILRALERLARELEEPKRDTILEVMDYLAGWCSPHMRID
jgi:hypothetical protein